MQRGVLLAVDKEQEWLLSWWWESYRRTNTLPVAIIDLGMSDQARAWCHSRLKVITATLDAGKIKDRAECLQDVASRWEQSYGSSVWKARQAWFRKPSSMLETPFQTTLWLDLDCEVLGPLDPIFSTLPDGADFGIVREPLVKQGDPTLLIGEVVYNSGVILYKKDAPILKRWAEESSKNSERFMGDQCVLSRIIFSEKIPIFELPEICNVQPSSGVIHGALIVHWVGAWGKEFIRKHGGLTRILNTL
ncbi:MAG: hypothetical protein HYX48_01440 [Chlamydiales bacterium]|nr:hypothetical protein [Chlamydiales bacterium]